MKRQMEITELFCNAMEIPPGSLTGQERLSEIENWDSLALLNLMALLHSRYGITLSPETILACDTMRDVERLFRESATT